MAHILNATKLLKSTKSTNKVGYVRVIVIISKQLSQVTLHQPFVGYETVKELILEGGRPPLTYRELSYPTYVLDLMVVCWSHRPRERPSASQIVSIASAPEFLHLADCVSIDQVCVIDLEICFNIINVSFYKQP